MARALSSGYDDGSNTDARRVVLDTTNFTNNLSDNDETVQDAMEKLDQLAPDLSSRVPYTGATGDVDLGAYDLITTNGKFNGNVLIGTDTDDGYNLQVNGTTLLSDKLVFTQTDGNEYIDSLADGYMDYGATTQHRFNRAVDIDGALTCSSVSEDTPTLLKLNQTTPQIIIATDTVITASDEVYFGDVTDSSKIKKDTVQGILDLVPAPDLSGLVKAKIQFDGLNNFISTISRRGRTKSAKTMTDWEMTANASGSASVTIKKASYTNLPSTLTTIGTITLTSAHKATGSLSVALDAGDYLIFELTSCSGLTELLVELF